MAELAPVRAAAGLGPLTLAAGPFTVADEDPGTARELAAACTARYLTAMGEIYPRVVSAQGLGAEVGAGAGGQRRGRPARRRACECVRSADGVRRLRYAG